MVARTVITIDAVYENGVLRPTEPLPLRANDRVTIRLELPGPVPVWPADTAEIYRELAEEDLALAGAMAGSVRATWPGEGGE